MEAETLEEVLNYPTQDAKGRRVHKTLPPLTRAEVGTIWEAHRCDPQQTLDDVTHRVAGRAAAEGHRAPEFPRPNLRRQWARPPPFWLPDETGHWSPLGPRSEDEPAWPLVPKWHNPLTCLLELGSEAGVMVAAARGVCETHLQGVEASTVNPLDYLFGGCDLVMRVRKSVAGVKEKAERARQAGEESEVRQFWAAQNARLASQLEDAVVSDEEPLFVVVLGSAPGWESRLSLLKWCGRSFVVEDSGVYNEVSVPALLKAIREAGEVTHEARSAAAVRRLFGVDPPEGGIFGLGGQKQEFHPEPLNRRWWRMLRWSGQEYRAARCCVLRELHRDPLSELMPDVHRAVVEHMELTNEAASSVELDPLWGMTPSHFAVLFNPHQPLPRGAVQRPDRRFAGTPAEWGVQLRYAPPACPDISYYDRDQKQIRKWDAGEFFRRTGAMFAGNYLIGHDYIVEVLMQLHPSQQQTPKYHRLMRCARESTGDGNLIMTHLGEDVGHGVFARRPFRQGEYICTYFGEVVSDLIFAETDDTSPGHYSMTMPGEIEGKPIDFRIDARRIRNLGGMVNHSSMPNAYTDAFVDRGCMVVVICAMRDIPTLEQVCIDYRWEGAEAMSEMMTTPLGRFPRTLDIPEGVLPAVPLP
eukprot:Hpha_TRINITY_DN7434_c0_g1::TRINITY_DN7434_c0_g1_i1::g.96000::m.96000